MALTYTEMYGSAAELTGFIRGDEEARPQAYALASYLPDETTDDIDFRAEVGGSSLKRSAVFRAYDAESPIVGTKAHKDISGSLPPISLKTRVSEYNRVKFNGRGGDQQIFTYAESNAVVLADAIRMRMEIARGEALMSGKVTLEENDLSLTVDFGRKETHTQTASQLWGTANGKPLTDLLAWRDIYSDTNGVDPHTMLVSRKVMTALINSEDIRLQIFGKDSGARIVNEEQLNLLLSAHGLPRVQVYKEIYEDSLGNAKPIIDPTKILFIGGATQEIGKTLWGIPADALEPKYGLTEAHQPGIFAANYLDDDPAALWVKASAVALPVVQKPNQTFSATVLSA